MKKLKSGDGADDRYDSKWKFFPALKFIVPSFTPTKSTSNFVSIFINLIAMFFTLNELVYYFLNNQPMESTKKII